MANRTEQQSDTAFAMAHFAATTSALVASALHRGKPIRDQDIKHLLGVLATSAANAPDSAASYFDALAGVLAGKQYEGG